MVRKLAFGLIALVCAQWAQATVQFYDNAGVVLAPPAIPPTIDAVNFINRNTFVVNFTNFYPSQWPTTTLPYNTSNTRTFTNGPSTTAFMSCNAGFDFESFFPASNQIKRASSFFNAGTIEAGTVTTSNQFNFNGFFVFGNAAKMIVSATNVINPGTINMGFETLLRIKGDSVDLTRGGFNMEGSGFTVANAGFIFFNNLNLFDGYWGIGDPVTQRPLFYPGGITPAFYWELQPYNTPFHIVGNRVGATVIQSLGGTTNFLSYLSDQTIISNRYVRAAFVSNTNSALQVNVYFPGVYGNGLGDIIVEYTNVLSTNSFGPITTNNLYLADAFGSATNFQLLVGNPTGATNGLIPFNYEFFLSSPLGLGVPTTSARIPTGTFGPGNVTNQYSAYEAIFNATSELLTDVAGQDVTNLPGKIEITADKVLNLTRARIGSLNYLSLKGTNHFVGSSKAQISAPYTDLNLRSTNGTLAVTNVIAPVVRKPEGIIDCFSARWTNVDTTLGITNAFHVLFVDTKTSPTFPSRVQTAILRANNAPAGSSDSLLISDNLNITRTLLLDAVAVTLTTNESTAANPFGTINVLTNGIVWSTATPRLKYLTNNGAIETLNAVFFGGSRSSPYYNSNFDEPYIDFVNRGIVSNYGSLIWSLDFQNIGTSTNTGIFYANSGAIDLEKARTTTLLNGSFLAPAGDIIVASDTLVVSNHILQAAGSINLFITNSIDDGSLASHSGNAVSNKNSWGDNSGFSLPTRPVQGSLLGTVVTNTAPAFAEVINQWGTADNGCSPSGFTGAAGSVPLGALILDGGQDSQFDFVGTGPGANALYVDYLEFKNFTTNRDVVGNFIGISISPNMTIYFANAVANGVSIAEKVNGKFGVDGAAGGHFCWVSGYAGAFSTVTRTNLLDGTPYQINAALAANCSIDSDGDGIANCNDPDPLHPPPSFTSSSLALTVSVTNSPTRAAVVSWNSVANATNTVYYKSATGPTNWLVLTNFVSGSAAGRPQVLDPMSGSGRLYRVLVNPPH